MQFPVELPEVCLEKPPVILEVFGFHNGKWEQHARKTYGAIGPARAGAAHTVVVYYWIYHIDPSQTDNWTSKRHVDGDWKIKVDRNGNPFAEYIAIRLSEYDQLSGKYVTADQFNFTV